MPNLQRARNGGVVSTGLHYFSRWERPTDETPMPNAWDHFACECGSLWDRINGEGYHRRRDGGVCDGPVEITYLNPPRPPRIVEVPVPCNRLHVDELPTFGQGLVRAASKLYGKKWT